MPQARTGYRPRGLGAQTLVETLTWDAAYGSKAAKITETLDGQNRRLGWQLQSGASLTALTTTMSPVTYAYTSGGDLASVTMAGMKWDYAYVPNTSLVDKITAGGTGLSTVVL